MGRRDAIVFAVLILMSIAPLFAGCNKSEQRAEAMAGQDASTGHEGHDHGAPDGQKSSQITVWGDRFEVFMEHPFVVADAPTEFVTHVTDRATSKPRRKGPVTFVLTTDSGVSTKHVEEAPARDGIYIPKLTFSQSGMWNVSLIIPADGNEHVVELPALTVYGSQSEVDRAPFPKETAGISYLKEQQWQIPFATEVVHPGTILSQAVLAVQESAILDENGKPVAFVQLAGETFEKRYLEMGKKEQGFVEVSSGLSEGEYVVTDGAYAVADAEHGRVSTVHLAKEDMDQFGIEVDRVGPGQFDVHLSFPGKITFNANKLAHIVPVMPGVVREVVKDIGDPVVAGEIIARLESTRLGGAKLDYLAKLAELSCCSVDLVRAQDVYDNTMMLLEALKSSPSLETLRKMDGSAMGMNRSLLVSSYAEFIFAEETYSREKGLYEKKISSMEDFLKAENAVKKTDAKYVATKDSVGFEIQRTLMETKRTQQIRETNLQAAERLLYVLGLTAQDVSALASRLTSQNSGGQKELECDDPNCAECLAEAASNNLLPGIAGIRVTDENLASYPVRAPIDGTIISKHLTLGEVVGDGTNIFVVADLSSVWVDLQVHQHDIGLIRKGQEVRISADSNMHETKGVIDYVDPVIDEKTRSALARVVLDNTSRQLRPGTFVDAKILVEKRDAGLVVPNSALQTVDDSTRVFVMNGYDFEARPVTVGVSNSEHVEIIAGLKPGETIVTGNGFRLKAELEKAATGGVAGHGHVH